MSFDKRQLKDIDRTQLTEIARIILSELSMNENLRLNDFLEENTATNIASAYEFNYGDESAVRNLNQGWGRQVEKMRSGIAGSEGFTPRYTRADFLSHRLKRRKRRGDKSMVTENVPLISENTVAESVPFIAERTVVDGVPFIAKRTVPGNVPYVEENTDSKKNIESEEPVYSELSEKISEKVCRDARRYDGAFERY